MPIFDAIHFDVCKDGVISALMMSGSISCTAKTLLVFWAVTAITPSIAAVGGKGFDIRLNSRAAAAIRACDGQEVFFISQPSIETRKNAGAVQRKIDQYRKNRFAQGAGHQRNLRSQTVPPRYCADQKRDGGSKG